MVDEADAKFRVKILDTNVPARNKWSAIRLLVVFWEFDSFAIAVFYFGFSFY